MPRVVSVRLRHPVQLYDFDAGDLTLSRDDWVIVETARGRDAGQVATPPREMATEEMHSELKSVVRLATAADLRRMERFRQREEQVLERAQEKVAEKDLPMRLVAAEYTYNGRSLTIYFTAEKRVDFRELVKELAKEFRTRIQLRQIGARDEARLLGGIGPCGRPLCCITFLRDFLRISVRMAKEQELPLSPMKISGVCGRLLCCLSYEYEQYREIKSQLPAVGDEVPTLHGKGTVTAVSVPKEAATVEVRPGLTVEATAEELAQAAQLEAEGKLEPVAVPLAYEIAIEEEEKTKEAPTSTPAKTKRRRRRGRSKKKAEEPQAAAPQQPGPPTSPPTDDRRKRRRRPRKKKPQEKSQERRSTAAATQQKDSQKARRRRPRRRRKDSAST